MSNWSVLITTFYTEYHVLKSQISLIHPLGIQRSGSAVRVVIQTAAKIICLANETFAEHLLLNVKSVSYPNMCLPLLLTCICLNYVFKNACQILYVTLHYTNDICLRPSYSTTCIIVRHRRNILVLLLSYAASMYYGIH